MSLFDDLCATMAELHALRGQIKSNRPSDLVLLGEVDRLLAEGSSIYKTAQELNSMDCSSLNGMIRPLYRDCQRSIQVLSCNTVFLKKQLYIDFQYRGATALNTASAHVNQSLYSSSDSGSVSTTGASFVYNNHRHNQSAGSATTASTIATLSFNNSNNNNISNTLGCSFNEDEFFATNPFFTPR